MKIRNWLLLGMLFLALPTVMQAQFVVTTNNGSVTITGYTGTNGNLIIPATINGYPVTGIGGFYGYVSFTNITIPASVTNIASGVLAYRTSLTAIMVAAQNTYYSSSNGILFDKYQTILIQAPGGKAGSYAIPGSVTSIGNYAFEGCGFTNLSIGTNVNSIGDHAFSFCPDLVDIAIPDSVTNIGSQAFYDCYSLTNLVLGANVASIGSGAFAECQSLPAITVSESNPFYSSVNGLLFDKLQTLLIQAPGGIAGSYALPTTTTCIGDQACSDCAHLAGLIMPAGITNIGSGAFRNCGSLTHLSLGANLTGIGDSAFAYCTALPRLAIPDGVVTIANSAFSHCGSLTNLSLGTNVSTIGAEAFAYCSSLPTLTIPASVTNIQADNLRIVWSPNGPRIASGPVAMVVGCSRLSSIIVEAGNPFYSSSNGVLFNHSQSALLEAPPGFVGSFAVPGNVLSIGGAAFQNCASLTTIAIPNSVTNIGSAAFAGCGSLITMTVDGQNMFYRSINGVLFNQSQTVLIQFPGGIGGSYSVTNGIVSLGSTAFSGCSNLTHISVPNSVTNVGYATFNDCLKAGIYFAGNAPDLTPDLTGGPVVFPFPGNGFYDPNAEAIYYLPGTTGWSASFAGIPAYLWAPPYICTPASDSITINGYSGSAGAITIPDTINGLPVTTITGGAFDNPNGVGLTNIILGTNLTAIGDYAFAACVHLASITIPAGVTNLGTGAFAFCDNLNSVYFQGNAPAAGTGVFFHWSGLPGYPWYPPIYEPPTPTTVYYLPGTTGWGTTFAGQPTVLWNPLPQTSGPSFGVRANGFGFNITGTSNLVVVVESAANLSNADWRPVQTLTLTNGTANFSDPQWTNYPGQFYRLRSP